MKTTMTGAGLLAGALLLGGGAAQATLVNYTAGGVNLVYDQDRNLTWAADANLFQTQYTADNTTVSKIIAAVPTVPDSYYGPHTVVAGDFVTNSGVMNWWGAMAWTQWLGSIGYGGASDWRLPATLQPDATCDSQFNAGGGFPLQGNGYSCTGSDLGHLFYAEGLLNPGQSIAASAALNQHFTTMQSSSYWTGTELAPGLGRAWYFSTGDGLQDYGGGKDYQYYGWAVRPGQVADVPLPATGLLMALGLLALGATRRARRATLVIR
ncbi:DUF1566 domain-containing protein [uncultured Thiodictyon sp.]|jgi:hypothetical protein|uniref:Lcl domain-containing protein n=1 Tax=uncultured Thiodictyon sp. TaxID=1846217 RepID=UPI0025E865E7|nr:DUF1566 domain-containing protein [uncultured Thiodictyon sp.]